MQTKKWGKIDRIGIRALEWLAFFGMAGPIVMVVVAIILWEY